MLAKGFLEQRHQLGDSPVHGRVIDLNTVFRNHLFEITQTQRIGHVPAHTPQNHVQREVQPLQNFGARRTMRASLIFPFIRFRLEHDANCNVSLIRLSLTTAQQSDLGGQK